MSTKRNTTIQDERWDHCEHLEVGDTATLVFCEDDSFGPVGRMAYCKECAVIAQEEADNELEYCHDCGEEHPAKNVMHWKWYDFYAQQGDEPIQVCNGCASKEKHVKRVEKNIEDMNAEYGDDDDFYD